MDAGRQPIVSGKLCTFDSESSSFNSNTKVVICAYSTNKAIGTKTRSAYNRTGVLLQHIGKISADQVKYRQRGG